MQHSHSGDLKTTSNLRINLNNVHKLIDLTILGGHPENVSFCYFTKHVVSDKIIYKALIKLIRDLLSHYVLKLYTDFKIEFQLNLKASPFN